MFPARCFDQENILMRYRFNSGCQL